MRWLAAAADTESGGVMGKKEDEKGRREGGREGGGGRIEQARHDTGEQDLSPVRSCGKSRAGQGGGGSGARIQGRCAAGGAAGPAERAQRCARPCIGTCLQPLPLLLARVRYGVPDDLEGVGGDGQRPLAAAVIVRTVLHFPDRKEDAVADDGKEVGGAAPYGSC